MDYVISIRLLVGLALLVVLAQFMRAAINRHRKLIIEARDFGRKVFSILPDGVESFLCREFGEPGGNRRRVSVIENENDHIVLRGRARSVNHQITEITIRGREPLIEIARKFLVPYQSCRFSA